MKPDIVIERAGVVYFFNGYEPQLKVNQFDFFDQLETELQEKEPPQDYDGRFAGRVRLEIEFFGEVSAEDASDG